MRSLPAALLTAALVASTALGPAGASATASGAPTVATSAGQRPVQTTTKKPKRPAARKRTVGLGVYAGPDSKGVTGAAAFDASMGQKSQHVLDFLPDATWSDLEGPTWAVAPHAHQAAQFELSVPMLPASPGATLARCATGADDRHWSALGRQLVTVGLSTTIVRPGWEANGTWYRWSAVSHPSAYAACFRHVVRAMRAVRGSAFRFDWTVAANLAPAQARASWPGARYVDFVGVDVYDTSWTNYRAGSTPTAADRASTLAYLINGSGGLAEWSRFAAAKGVPMAVPEWGVSTRADGHGGGDDPAFVSAMFDFFADASHHVAFEHYFNTAEHQLTGATAMPRSAAMFRQRVASLRTRRQTAVTTSPSPAPTATPGPTAPTTTTPTPTTSAPAPGSLAVPAPNSKPLDLYAPTVAAQQYVTQYPKLSTIAATPQATWLGPDWAPNPTSDLQQMGVAAAGRTIELVVYGIPNRDNGGYSSGGAADASSYYGWVQRVANGIGRTKAIVVLEPDALGLSQQLPDADRAAREHMLAVAVAILKAQPYTHVYLDASTWIPADQQAALLQAAGVQRADGFALNTSGYGTVGSNITYGMAVSNLLAGKHFVIDTSRAGQGGAPGQWCNPAGQGLGPVPQRPGAYPRVDALLWVKHPGESDGPCNGGPGAGTFSPSLALDLIAHADYRLP